jgi:hypothetical protein
MMVRTVERDQVLWHKFEKVLNLLLVHYSMANTIRSNQGVHRKKGMEVEPSSYYYHHFIGNCSLYWLSLSTYYHTGIISMDL